MPDVLKTSLSGMLAFQRALEVTGHNIANANTPGYSRQIVDLSARAGQSSGAGFIGSGVQVAAIKRVYDEMLVSQLRTATSGQSRLDVLSTMASRIDNLLADPATGLSSGLDAFFGAVQDVANDPGSIPARQALLAEADGVVQRFQSLDRQLSATGTEVNQRISVSVDEINRLAGAIADVNNKIAVAGTAQPPNDLLDQRDRLVRDLAEQVSVSTALQDDGTLSVFIGSGQTLVIGVDAKELAVQGSRFDPTRLEVVYRGTSGNTPLDSGLSGGALGGLLEFRDQVLDPARQELGQTAVAFAQSFNTQHRAGMDLRGQLGEDFFSIASPKVLHSSENTGAGDAAASVTDLSALTGDDYVLSYDGAAYSLELASTGQAVALTGSGTAGDPFVAAGLSITVSGAPAAGDELLIRSSLGAPESLGVAAADAQAIAMAAPTRTAASLANIGDASIGPASVVDRNDPNLLATALVEFTSATTYTVDGSGPFAYTDGAPIVVNGSQFTISGAPAAGDEFTLEANYGATGDNANGLLLGDVQSVDILDGGTVSIVANYGQLVAGIGTTTRQAQASLDAQNVVLTNVEDAQLAKSGVNLDEEAANMIRYQQAYQASAQVVSVISLLFDSLLQATSR